MRRLTWIEAGLLEALWHLRYLTTAQIHHRWFAGRTLTAAEKRLSRLAADDVLRKGRFWRRNRSEVGWSLGAEGLRQLRALRDDEFLPTMAVRPQFLAHLVETNDVFLALAGEQLTWEGLSFGWAGSHRAAIPYTREGGRPAALRPDAIITPVSGPRILLELDRSTETITARPWQQSIERKLHAYRRVLTAGRGDGRAFLDTAFGDRRGAVVLFVTAKRDNRARDEQQRERRQKSILRAAAAMFLPAGVVQCAGLHEVDRIRQLCRVAGPASEAPKPNAAVSLTVEHLHLLTAFYRLAAAAFIRLRPDSRIRAPLRASALQVQALLRDLSPDPVHTAELEEALTWPTAAA